MYLVQMPNDLWVRNLDIRFDLKMAGIKSMIVDEVVGYFQNYWLNYLLDQIFDCPYYGEN